MKHYNVGKNNSFFGKHHTKETIQKMKNNHPDISGEKNPNFKDGRCFKKILHCKEQNCNNEIEYKNWKYGQGRCQSCAKKHDWKNKKFREKIIKASLEGSLTSPNKPERQLNKILQNILPNEYKFVGNGKIIIDRFCPDFINVNGQKKIIEHYGDYFHNLDKHKKIDKKRIKTYAEYGYKTLIIWQHELKNLDKVKNRILEFNKI